LYARILSLSTDGISLKLHGGKELRMGLADLAPAQVYHLRRRALDPKTVTSHHALAAFCVKHGLSAFAAREYRAIGALQPNLAEVVPIWLARVPVGEPDRLYAQGWDALAAQDYRRARERFRDLVARHGKNPLAARARSLLDPVSRLLHLSRAELLHEIAPQTQRMVVYIEDQIEETTRLLTEAAALAKKGEVDRAREIHEKAEEALVLGRRIYRTAGPTCRTRKGRVFFKEKLRRLEKRLVETLIVAAEFHISVRDWARARKRVVVGLGLDRKNPRLRELAERINEHYRRD
jgi:tetratricopeptide (TPR) repeat protein